MRARNIFRSWKDYIAQDVDETYVFIADGAIIPIGEPSLINTDRAHSCQFGQSPVQHDMNKTKEHKSLKQIEAASVGASVKYGAKMREPGMDEAVARTKAQDYKGTSYSACEFEERTGNFDSLKIQFQSLINDLHSA